MLRSGEECCVMRLDKQPSSCCFAAQRHTRLAVFDNECLSWYCQPESWPFPPCLPRCIFSCAFRKVASVVFLMNPQLQNHVLQIRKLHQNGVWASGENPLQSDQAATNSSRRQNTILVNILNLQVMIFELRVCRNECERGRGG